MAQENLSGIQPETACFFTHGNPGNKARRLKPSFLVSAQWNTWIPLSGNGKGKMQVITKNPAKLKLLEQEQ